MGVSLKVHKTVLSVAVSCFFTDEALSRCAQILVAALVQQIITWFRLVLGSVISQNGAVCLYRRAG